MGLNGSTWQVVLLVIAGLLVVTALISFVVWVMFPVGRGIGWLFRHIWRFIAGECKDAARFVACVIVVPVFAVLALLSLMFIQKASALRFGRALHDEGLRMVVCIYRVFIGHPARLLGLETALEGIETRLPTVLTGTWGDAVSPRQGLFPGYTVLRTMPGGGSGAKLYIAQPEKRKLKELAKDGYLPLDPRGGEVVIKSFTTYENDGLLTIVRESRALDAGRRMGLILEHVLTPERFYYVMRFVPGENLRVITTRLHMAAGEQGLDDVRMRLAFGYVRDLLITLRGYHDNGLWHKDVKPDNIIVEAMGAEGAAMIGSASVDDDIESLRRSPVGGSRPGRATLVDFGLVSSLRSAMTLTTHGTEYFRDPEMVRQALRGVKVHEVDGVRFDIYAVGAVLFSLIEDSFPAQGVLSPIKKRCPQGIAWIIRRAMTDYDQRYESVRAVLADLDRVLASEDMFAVRPADLPSMGGEPLPVSAHADPDAHLLPAAHAGETDVLMPELVSQGGMQQRATIPSVTGVAVTAPARTVAADGAGSVVRLKSWWTGNAEVVGELPESMPTAE